MSTYDLGPVTVDNLPPLPTGTAPGAVVPEPVEAPLGHAEWQRQMVEAAVAGIEAAKPVPSLDVDQIIRVNALRLAVDSYGAEVDTASREDIAEVGLYFAEVIATGRVPAEDLRPMPRGRDEAEHLVAQALEDAWPGEPFGDDRVFTEQVAAVAVRTLGALLRDPAPAHSTASEGTESAQEPRTGPGEGDGKPDGPEGESGAAQDHAALAYRVCVPCALRQPGCGQEPQLIHSAEVTA
jgi:hypothetical protein